MIEGQLQQSLALTANAMVDAVCVMLRSVYAIGSSRSLQLTRAAAAM
jgi:hypothetical protein